MSYHDDQYRDTESGFWHPLIGRLISAFVAGAASLLFLQSGSIIGLASHFSEAVPELVIFLAMTAFGFAFPLVTGCIFFGTLALLALALLIP